MESVLGRYRNLIILMGVLFLQLLGLAVQVRRTTDTENTRLIRIWAVSTITPLERGLVWVQSAAGNLWHSYAYLRGVRTENRQLKEQIEQMRLEQVRLSEDAAQAHRLQALLAFKEQFIAKTVAAQVIGSSGSDLSRSIYIDKGSDAGIQQDMAVITAEGIVGKVLRVYPSTSLILLINDQSSGVGAVLEKTRLQGVLRGTANGQVILERVMRDEQVLPGEMVLTSGGDQIFPKGLPAGTVAKVESGKELFLNIRVKPAANLSKLEEVLVVVQKQEREATAEDSVRVRAADILAQRLPSVPDKQVTDRKSAGSVAAGNAPSGATNTAGPSTGIRPLPRPTSETKPPGPTVKPQGAPVGKSASSGTVITPVQKTAAPKPPLVGSEPTSSEQKPENPKTSPKSDQPAVSPAQTPSQPPINEDSPH